VHRELESPFLDAELSMERTTPEWEPRVSALASESPFVDALMPSANGGHAEPEPETHSDGDQQELPRPDEDEVIELELADEEEHEAGGRITSLSMRKKQPAAPRSRVRARILWPALGFPAVIAPRTGHAADSPMADGDATRCICVLLLSDSKNLSKEEAARYLRYVPWDARGRRHIAQNATEGVFKEEELSVRNHEAGPKMTIPLEKCDVKKPPAWCLGDLIFFGGDVKGRNKIVVNLARCVRNFYREQKLKYLHEIRISEEASGRLRDGQYNLFWNNESPDEREASSELKLLLDGFAVPRRKKLSEFWQTKEHQEYLLHEYEYEYGVNHPPYVSKLAMRRPRTEILHPLFVDRSRGDTLKIGHVTDTHVDVRADIYEENLRHAGRKKTQFNNYNSNFAAMYADAKNDANAILMTGDLIDYGRGHLGLSARQRLDEDDAYHVDRNWFLFYYLLAAGDSYTTPVYTSLGNHDWRLNPYPPFATGAPSPASLLHDYASFNTEKPKDRAALEKWEASRREQKQIIIDAHGPGHELAYSYSSDALEPLHLLKEDQDPKKRLANFKAVVGMFLQKKTLDVKGFPTETTVESVAWYLMAINPFLDYTFPLPGGFRVLMLDWVEDEDVLFPIVVGGKEYPYFIWSLDKAGDPGQKARNSISPLQETLIEFFAKPSREAKVVGIHAPPIGPFPDWTDEDLRLGRKTYANKETARGPMNYVLIDANGKRTNMNGHPLFAIRPKGAGRGVEAHHGSFSNKREWFIEKMAKSGVRLVLAGHIHRNGLFVVSVPPAKKGSAVAGEMLIRLVTEKEVASAPPPSVSRTADGKVGPLYVNTTSAGPRGNYHPRAGQSFNVNPGYARVELGADGTIRQVTFRARRGKQRTDVVVAAHGQPVRRVG
jgi:hypothetical protein